MRFIKLAFFTLLIVSCSSSETITEDHPQIESSLYFPPISGSDWETVTTSSLGWNDHNIQLLLNYIEEKDTKAFIVLKNGKIAIEWYGNGADASTNRQWNSAGKTLSAFTMGIAQQEGFLNINDTSQDYLGANWSQLTDTQEKNISIKNHLNMTTGLDYNVQNIHCYDPECLNYLNTPDTEWFYHNAPYTLTQAIITNATGTNFRDYFNTKLRDKIGMQGFWFTSNYNEVFFSTARSMARFGLLNLNQGIWDDQPILSDTNYFTQMTTTSQNINPSYGYLWWLNGKGSYIPPGVTFEIQAHLIPNAPSDLYAALGKNDQKLYVIPSENLVIVRLGEDAGETLLGPSSFDNEIWEKINAVIN